ncbi:MAG: LemA protein [Parcubacteria group bacterium GW2011_GWB1_49_7]|uniref:LemA family protein n=1 Tax=Candidatus Zambryskibacteria bacterium RIFCSPHIGHO2_01_FULL_46_25 TaxID=1802738 RepID=A0A1G2SZN7_9BACT|nr:MAG: LemA protein [Parcubacteria group bacterium GW2011_GWA1_47_10]KKW09764.1 MAG: LemA protein [Parcubacteria group bacterium GW2011_GWB1_49_7]OHA90322.1 MAG: LemA family protein [Candidatus Zambryskibacteria bacterium RIFCSPHIGHO2_01_FULL_46_25]OHB01113.1 MAG: LemA family protein [Candidatus Zambryskibacteria bacterium RIFCSPHIGHO2_12_FULL_48_10]OHB06863.1 MAG: LemA family protein [Candidatus Zambryskibacteria bacterium RIFCSPLOWO2_01_FULL_48_25]
MNKSIIVLIGVVAILAIWGFSGYNGLVTLNENADAQWAKVETQYQRRFDLIPNLVNSVKAILTQEQTVFGDIADARTRYAGATTPDEKAAAASQVEGALGRLLVIVENYPQLESSSNVRDLMAQLEGTENRVSVERTRFNDEIRAYNTTVKRFPKNMLARLFGFGERSYFEAANGAENAPQVNF